MDRVDGRRHASEHTNGFDGRLGEWASKQQLFTSGNGLRSDASELPGAGISSQDDPVRSKKIDLFNAFSQVMSDHMGEVRYRFGFLRQYLMTFFYRRNPIAS
jgi:hypothetical protein